MLFRTNKRVKQLEHNIKEIVEILGLGTFEDEPGKGISDIYNTGPRGGNTTGALTVLEQKLEALVDSLEMKLKERKGGGYEVVMKEDEECK